VCLFSSIWPESEGKKILDDLSSQKRYRRLLLTLFTLNLVVAYVSLTQGVFALTGGELFKTILDIGHNIQYRLLIFDFRLPRIIAAVIAGMALGVAGAVFQGITRNGLADSGVLGINAGAGFGIMIYLALIRGKITQVGWEAGLVMPLFGLAGGLVAALGSFFCSRQNGKIDSERLLLNGIAIGSGLGAASLYLALKMNVDDFQTATLWMAGNLSNVNWRQIFIVLPWIFGLIALIIGKVTILDLFQLEEDSAKSLGVAIKREKIILLLAGVGLVSVSIFVAGGIGFVGLIAPHLAKRLTGHKHYRIIPICAGIGMLLVTGADLIGRTVFAPSEVAVGLVIALIGAPYFFYLWFQAKT
jgi:iron complex transport system permease protein